MSWVTNSTVLLERLPDVQQQLLHQRRVCASSAPNGSSISSTLGL